MGHIITLTAKKDTGFFTEAKSILESHKFVEVSDKTYFGTKSTQSIIGQLKELEVYKKEKVTKGIVLYHGNVSKV